MHFRLILTHNCHFNIYIISLTTLTLPKLVIFHYYWIFASYTKHFTSYIFVILLLLSAEDCPAKIVRVLHVYYIYKTVFTWFTMIRCIFSLLYKKSDTYYYMQMLCGWTMRKFWQSFIHYLSRHPHFLNKLCIILFPCCQFNSKDEKQKNRLLCLWQTVSNILL